MQKCNAFDVSSLRKEVSGLHPLEVIPLLTQEMKVTGQGGGVATHIDNCGDVVWVQVLHQSRRTAFAGRIENEQVWVGVVGETIFHGSDRKGCIGDVVEGGVGLGLTDGSGIDFNAENGLNVLGKGEAQGADPAVGVDDPLMALKLQVGQNLLEEHLGLFGIDLEEGGGLNLPS